MWQWRRLSWCLGQGLWVEDGKGKWMAMLEIGSWWLMDCWELLELEWLE